jgi:hypothetical protein
VPTPRTRCAAVVAVVPLLLAGCGSLSADEVDDVATAFAGSEDGATRCDLLAAETLASLVEETSTTCDEAIAEVPLGSGEVESIEVWGEEAQARLSDDVLFLTHTTSGWRIAAAACTFRGEGRPYDCQLEAS